MKKTAPPPAAADSGAQTDASMQADADACDNELSDDLGVECMASTECGCAAPYCAVAPNSTKGTCTVRDCTPNGDDCPEGYSCFDVSVFGAEGIPTFCLAM